MPFILLLMVLIGNIPKLKAQQSSTEQELAIKNLLKSHHYFFHAITVTPLAGGERQLSLIYTVAVYKNFVVSDLPFIGQAYTAPTVNYI